MEAKRKEPVQTILAITTGFLAGFLIFNWKWAVWASLFIGLAGLLSPFLSEKIAFVWAKLGYVLSLIVPTILLSAVFYLFLFPIAVLSRLFGNKDPLILKRRPESMYVNRDRPFDKESFEKPW